MHLLLSAFAALTPSPLQDAPEALSSALLEPYTLRFRLVDGAPSGPGADALLADLAAHHVVLLGEYHGSTRLSELVTALVPRLHDAGFRHMAVETGPRAAELLTELARDQRGAAVAIAAYTAQHRVARVDRTYSVLPFFEAPADAAFLAAAIGRDWRLFGFDQEFLYGLPAQLADLGAALPREHADRVADAIARTRAAFQADFDGGARAAVALTGAPWLTELLGIAADAGLERRAADLRTSLEIYRLNATGDWWRSNGMRIQHMKENLARGLAASGFSLPEDRLFVKVGAVHSGRGLSLLRHYEIGNTLSELAELHGTRSLHLCVADRFSKTEAGIVDNLESDPRYEVIRRLGREDEWTLVDLRPLRPKVLYDRIEAERFVEEWFTQHDLVLITPADE